MTLIHWYGPYGFRKVLPLPNPGCLQVDGPRDPYLFVLIGRQRTRKPLGCGFSFLLRSRASVEIASHISGQGQLVFTARDLTGVWPQARL